MKYLSDEDVDFSEATATNIPVITSGTGRGKTTYSVSGALRQNYERSTGFKASKYIVVTPLSATANQIKEHWVVYAIDRETKDISCVYFGTHSKLCTELENGLDLTDSLVVLDEIHRFVLNTSYQGQMAHLVSWMIDQKKLNSCRFVGLSGTPQILFGYLNKDPDLPFKFYDATKGDRSRLKTDNALYISHGSLFTYAESIKKSDGKKLLYAMSAKSCASISSKLNSRGIRAAFIISEYHKNRDLVDEMNKDKYNGMTIREYLGRFKNVPPEIQVLIINDSFAEGADITDEKHLFNEVAVESVCIADIQQVRSRIRHDIARLTVVYNETGLERTIEKLATSDDFTEFFRSTDESEKKKLLERRLELQDEQNREKENSALLVVLDAGKDGKSKPFLNPFISSIVNY